MDTVDSSTSTLSSEEVVLVVDSNNQPIGKEKRKVVRQQNLWHRASYIFVYNKNHEFYVQKRSMLKDYCPGYYDLCNGGVVGGDETDEENAKRELEEEIGVTGVELKLLKHIKFEDETNRVWGNLYAIQYDGDVKLQAEEVDEILFWNKDEIQKRIDAGDKITPDSIMAFKELMEMGVLN